MNIEKKKKIIKWGCITIGTIAAVTGVYYLYKRGSLSKLSTGQKTPSTPTPIVPKSIAKVRLNPKNTEHNIIKNAIKEAVCDPKADVRYFPNKKCYDGLERLGGYAVNLQSTDARYDEDIWDALVKVCKKYGLAMVLGCNDQDMGDFYITESY